MDKSALYKRVLDSINDGEDVWNMSLERYNGMRRKANEVCRAMKELVMKCYDDVMSEYSKALAEDRRPVTSDIKRDWQCSAAEEWDFLTGEEAAEQFDTLYREIAEDRKYEALGYI